MEPESEPSKEATASTFYKHHPLAMDFTILIDIAVMVPTITAYAFTLKIQIISYV